jgi:hypothetical protein
MHPRLARLAPALTLAALTLIAFARLVAEPSGLLVDVERPSLDHARPPGARAVGNDLTRLFLPHHLRVGESFRRHGRVPGWDPAGFGGRPMVGNPQGGLWYPPTWLAWLSGAPAALGWLTVAHLAWGGLGAFALARSIGLGRGAAIVAGGVFELSPYMIAQAFEGHYPHAWAAAWMPWAFRAALGLRRGRIGRGLTLPPILALAFLTGHPQEAYYLALVLGGWGALEVIRRSRSGGPIALASGAAALAAPAALALGLTAVEWLPDREASAWGLASAGLSAGGASRYSVGPLNLLQLIGPRALGGPSGYLGDLNWWDSLLAFGAVPLGLALIGLARSRRRGAALGWGALVGLTVAFAAGRSLGLFSILFAVVPGMDRFRVPARALFLASMGVAMLAALGVEALARSRRDWTAWARRATALALAIAAALIAGASAAARLGVAAASPEAIRSDEAARWLRAAWNLAHDPIALGALAAVPAALAWLGRHPSDRRRVAAALGTLALAELLAYTLILIRVAPPERFLGRDARADAIARAEPGGPYRIRARDASFDDLRAVAWGIEKTNIDDSFQIQHAAELYEPLYLVFDPPRLTEMFDPQTAWFHARTRQATLDRLNVALLISDRPEPHAPWPVAASGPGFVLYRNPTAMPRAYVVPRVQAWPDDPSVAGLLAFVPPREAVVLPSDPLEGASRRQPFTPAEYASPDPDRVEVRVATEAPGLLVVADTWMPGWTATLDGRPAPILKGNRSQRVVVLPTPGAHTVILRYEPPGLVAGLAITGASLAAWLAACAIHRRRAAQPRSTNESRPKASPTIPTMIIQPRTVNRPAPSRPSPSARSNAIPRTEPTNPARTAPISSASNA